MVYCLPVVEAFMLSWMLLSVTGKLAMLVASVQALVGTSSTISLPAVTLSGVTVW